MNVQLVTDSVFYTKSCTDCRFHYKCFILITLPYYLLNVVVVVVVAVAVGVVSAVAAVVVGFNRRIA